MKTARKPDPVTRMVSSRTYTRSRAVFGVLFIGFGCAVIVQLVMKTGFILEIIPGCILGLLMIALGYVRIRAAFETRKPPAP